MTTTVTDLHDVTQLSDEELMEHFSKTGHSSYFGELYRRYARLGFGVCLKYLKNEADSRDVLSEVFRILHRVIPTANIQSFKKYFYTVTRNECMGKLRQRQKEYDRLNELKNFEKNSNPFMENEGLIRLLDSEPSMEKVVESAIGKLNKEQRTCINLFFFEDKSYKEIVQITGYTDKQVKSFLQNGKRNLKIMLTDYFTKKNS
ncbi:MAG: sigma-70 family RNA polymerase sigma factor [Bacteroidetes bacterium]|nr:MAG: sigma-70 family RNA polymerase sigma factor [Bacteroidota bacterium]